MTAAPHAIDPRANAFRPDLADISLRPFIAAARYVEPVLRRCMRGVLPLLIAPEKTARQISEIRYGEFLDVFEERTDGFSWVQNREDRMVGYIETTGSYNETVAALANRVSALRTFLYAEAAPSASVLDCLTLGSYISLEGGEGNFYPLTSGGFVAKVHVAPSDEVFCADHAFTAGQLLGTPFRAGGRTPLGIDAEGLVQLALDLSGVGAPRTNDQQREAFGLPLPCHWKDVVWKRGDLVFFENPTLVGIMAGETHVIVADPAAAQTVAIPLLAFMENGAQIVAAGHP